MTSPKRKYVRLPLSAWAELRAYWESGDFTHVTARRIAQPHYSIF
jgi:hypothetical protein